MSAKYTTEDLMNGVSIKNRIVDAPVKLTHDAVQWEWQPGEVKTMPRKLAEWFQHKSLFHFNPGDVNEGIPSKSEYKLAILNVGQDESDLTREYVSSVKELLDTEHMPETFVVDPATGKRMRRVYIDPRSTGARDTFSAKERQATERVSKAIVQDGAEKIAEVAAQTGTAEVSEADWKADLPPLVNPATGRAVPV